ncbi:hypothetical protein SAMN05444369_1062 [Capnocytophaga haemolytica]|uniref:Multidrug efflux pump VmrA n=1 Tax=Capnocytophaga haemolytica TaxID=45243 RepID=A0AAX2H036_9FLAO|nr:hypothetical protein [Capnocytophaga haemolytica]SFN97889.1 hypothetical protein SAMN05444369_1062 [Capnocytophaga haemolytica]SNV09722.1 multidrug efflux pump VmrA [Capnocytophaga haemolytica]
MKSNLDDTYLLEHSPIDKLFLKYALPSVVTVLFFGLQNLVDGIIVGNYVGGRCFGRGEYHLAAIQPTDGYCH